MEGSNEERFLWAYQYNGAFIRALNGCRLTNNEPDQGEQPDQSLVKWDGLMRRDSEVIEGMQSGLSLDRLDWNHECCNHLQKPYSSLLSEG